MSKSPPSSKFSRTTKLLGAASRFAYGELSKKLQGANQLKAHKIFVKQALALANSLDQLKGFPMKLGQILSLDATGMIPPEVRQVLERLQNNASAVDTKLMKQVFESEIGANAKELEVNWNPIASASIGQVYRAQDKEKNQLVLKIQYPGIEHSLEGDLTLIRKMAPIFTSLTGRELNWNEIFDELSMMFQLEIDYDREGKMLQQFYDAVKKDDPWIIPKFYNRYSGRKVIAMEYIEGLTLTQWLETAPSKPDKIFVANSLISLFFRELFEWGIVQTDPNFANFLITEDNKIALLDFGATLEYGPDFVNKYRSLLRVLYKGNQDEVITQSIEFNLLDPRESKETQDLYFEMVNVAIAPFIQKSAFVFGNLDYVEEAKKTSLAFLRSTRFTPPPRHLIFLHRKLGGLYTLLQRLEVTIDLDFYWREWIDSGVQSSDI